MPRRISVLTAALCVAPLASLIAQGTAQQTAPKDTIVAVPGASYEDAPSVRVWIDGTREMHNGQDARVLFSTDREAFVTVARIDADGRLSILFPRSPLEDGAVGGNQTFLIDGRDGTTFRTGERPGVGMIFAVASDDPLDLRNYALNNGWRHTAGIEPDPQFASVIAPGRVSLEAVQRFARSIVASERTPYNYDVEYYTIDSLYLQRAGSCYSPSGVCRAAYVPSFNGYDVTRRSYASFASFQVHFFSGFDPYCSSWAWYGLFYSPCHWVRPRPSRVFVYAPIVRTRPVVVYRPERYRPPPTRYIPRTPDRPRPSDDGPRRTAHSRPVERVVVGTVRESDRLYDMPSGGMRARRPLRPQTTDAEPPAAEPRSIERAPVRTEWERNGGQIARTAQPRDVRRESRWSQPQIGYGPRIDNTPRINAGRRERVYDPPTPRAIQPRGISVGGDRPIARTYEPRNPERYGRRRP
jgi:uncharacterized protein DUF4384